MVDVPRVNVFGYLVTEDTYILAWGSLVGSFIGSLLAGVIAFWVMKLQFGYVRKNTEIESIKNFLKAHHVFRMWIFSAYDNSSIIKRLMMEEQMLVNPEERQNNFGMIKNMMYVMEECSDRLSRIDHVFIPQKVYEQFISGIQFVDLALNEIKAYIENGHARNKISGTFFNYHEKWMENIVKLRDFAEQQEKKIMKRKKIMK